MIFCTEAPEWMARNLGFCSSTASARSFTSGSTAGFSSAVVELSSVELFACNFHCIYLRLP